MSFIAAGEILGATARVRTLTIALEFERCLLPDDLALVPWLAMSSFVVGFHDGPPTVWRHHAAASAPAPAMAPNVHH
jgi:hypothetical protein